MKRNISGILAVVILMTLLAGCGGGENTSSDVASAPAEEI